VIYLTIPREPLVLSTASSRVIWLGLCVRTLRVTYARVPSTLPEDDRLVPPVSTGQPSGYLDVVVIGLA